MAFERTRLSAGRLLVRSVRAAQLVGRVKHDGQSVGNMAIPDTAIRSVCRPDRRLRQSRSGRGQLGLRYLFQNCGYSICFK